MCLMGGSGILQMVTVSCTGVPVFFLHKLEKSNVITAQFQVYL